jgi:hypothetical protein
MAFLICSCLAALICSGRDEEPSSHEHERGSGHQNADRCLRRLGLGQHGLTRIGMHKPNHPRPPSLPKSRVPATTVLIKLTAPRSSRRNALQTQAGRYRPRPRASCGEPPRPADSKTHNHAEHLICHGLEPGRIRTAGFPSHPDQGAEPIDAVLPLNLTRRR